MSSVAKASGTSRAPSRSDWILAGAAIVLGIAAFALYLATLAPSITWANNSTDSGELAAAVATGGLAHPTGYPLYLLLGRIATALSTADPAHGLNVFSAACAAIAVSVMAWLATRESGIVWGAKAQTSWTRLIAAAVTALSLALAGAFWSQAVVTETRALACMLMAAVLVALRLMHRGRLHPAWACLVTGLSLADHLMAAVLFPSALMLAALALHRNRWRGSVMTVLAFCAGPLLYLYLPLRALASPGMDWGDPATLDRLLWVISGTEYHGLLGWGDAGFLSSLGNAVGGLKDQIGWPVIVLAGVGVLALVRSAPWWLAALLAVVPLSVLLVAGDQAEAGPYYILPAVLILALLAGYGAGAAAAVLARAGTNRQGSALRVATGACIVLVLVLNAARLASAGYDLVAATQQSPARAFGINTINQLAARSVVLVQGDENTFSLWYAHYALGLHADAAIVNVDLLRWPWYARLVGERLNLPAATRDAMLADHSELSPDDLASQRMVLVARALLRARPIFLLPEQYVLVTVCREIPEGDLFRCVPRP